MSVASRAGPGAIFLGVDCVAGLSTVTSARSHQPARLLVPVPRGPAVWAFTSSFGGGLVAGDLTSLDIRLGEGAQCYLGSQASSKVYRNNPSRPSGHATTATLAPGALLVVAPDPVQPFAGATYAQNQRFVLAPDASLILLDWVNAGRTARGERWAFQRYRSCTEVLVGGRRVFLDTLLLDPADGPVASEQRLGRLNSLATLTMVGPALRTHAGRVLEEISQRPVQRRPSLFTTASPIQDGVLVRLAGESPEAVGNELRQQLGFLRELLHDDPWERKR